MIDTQGRWPNSPALCIVAVNNHDWPNHQTAFD